MIKEEQSRRLFAILSKEFQAKAGTIGHQHTYVVVVFITYERHIKSIKICNGLRCNKDHANIWQVDGSLSLKFSASAFKQTEFSLRLTLWQTHDRSGWMLIDNRKAIPKKNRFISDQTFLQNKFGFKHLAERDYYNLSSHEICFFFLN